MKKILATLILALLVMPAFSQEGEDYPVRLFETSILIDNQTVTTPFKGMIEFEIHHRFGTVNSNGIDDLFGLWALGNIRLGLNYGISDKLMIGVGTAKNFRAQDLAIKYALLRQTNSGSMPISLTLYGNMAINLLSEDTFGPAHDWKEIHRLSYFTQAIFARQFSKLSLQVAPTLIYFNAVEIGYKNLNYGLSAGAKYNVFGSHSLLLEYDQLFSKQDNEDFNPKPQLGVGWEISTATHAFQIFFANYKDILGQYNFLYNQNSIADGNYLLGLNITVRF